MENKVTVEIPRIFLTKDSVETCSKCKKYLSVGPITLEKNEPVCGRCHRIEGAPAPFYEKLAHYMFFPCINDITGCDATLAWGSVVSHEKICPFSPMECPAITCEDKIEPNQIIQHYQMKHQDLFITTSSFNVPCRHGDANEYVNKLILWNRRPFIVKINFSSTCCFCSILSWDDSTEKLKYNLLIEDNKKRQSLHIKDIPLSRYRIKHHDNLTMTKIDIDIVKRILSTDKVICTFSIVAESSKNKLINTNLLSELECPVCTNYMKPPIFMCNVGHSLCGTCKQNISNCPSCKVYLGDNRNISLEKITEHIDYPCKFSDLGCSFTGKISEINLHELVCCTAKVAETECYVNCFSPCNWKGSHSKVFSHIALLHSNYLIDIDKIIFLDLCAFETLKVFIGKQGKTFRLFINYVKMCNIKFCLNIIKTSKKNNEKFRFFIDFVDQNGSGKILDMSKDCIPSLASDESFNNFVMIPYALLKPFVKNNNLQFKINIVEIY